MIKKINGMLVVAVALSTLSVSATDVVAAVDTGWKKTAIKAAGVAGVAAAFLLALGWYNKTRKAGNRLGHGPAASVPAPDPVVTRSELTRLLGDLNTNLRTEIGVVRGNVATNKDEQAQNLRTAVTNFRDNLAAKADSAVLEGTNGRVSGLEFAMTRAQQSLDGYAARVESLEKASEASQALSLRMKTDVYDLRQDVKVLKNKNIDHSLRLQEAEQENIRNAHSTAMSQPLVSAPLADEAAAHVSASEAVATPSAESAPAPQAEAAHA